MRDEVRIDVRPIAEAVARELPGWTWRERTDDYGDNRDEWTELHSDTVAELRIHVACNRYQKPPARLSISGTLPRELQRHRSSYHDAHKLPTITVAATRAPTEIAGEIRRRILPGLFPTLAAVQGIAVEHAENVKATLNVAALIATACPAFRPQTTLADEIDRGGRAVLHAYPDGPGYGTAMAYADSVSLELRSLPVNVAVAILAALAPFWPPKAAEQEEADEDDQEEVSADA